eukprot:1181069-Prorocentrum_minimum.AAC.3
MFRQQTRSKPKSLSRGSRRWTRLKVKLNVRALKIKTHKPQQERSPGGSFVSPSASQARKKRARRPTREQTCKHERNTRGGYKTREAVTEHER